MLFTLSPADVIDTDDIIISLSLSLLSQPQGVSKIKMNLNVGMYRDEMAKFLIKNKKLISEDSAILKIKFPRLLQNYFI